MKATGKSIGRLVVGCILACSLTSKLLAQSTATGVSNTGEARAQRAAAEAAQLQLLTQAMAQAEAEAQQAQLNLEARQSGARANLASTANAGISAMGLGFNSLTNTWDFGTNGASPNDQTNPPPPDISNYAKFVAQAFLVLDTNVVVTADMNLYNVCAGFSDTNTTPLLQIAEYEPGVLVMKASHFDYSTDSRNFALVVCDRLETPLFKNIDISNPANNMENGGWLVQGSVPSWQVTDPMFLMVSNISLAYNAFFQVIPYGGPTVQLTGQNPYDVVSNTVALQVNIQDLSGITNEAFEVTVDGNPARYGIGSGNAVTLQSPYNPNGPCTIYANAINEAQICDIANPPSDMQVYYSASASLPLDFENDTYLAFAGDNASPLIGTNYSLFVIDKAQDITATVTDPSNGNIVAAFSGYVPYPATVEIPWNFTMSDGVTLYTNDSYVVHFIAYDPADIRITNKISRNEVRTAGQNIVTYEYEDTNGIGQALNSAADSYIYNLEIGLYEALYDRDWWGMTQYGVGQIGAGRDNSSGYLFPWALGPNNQDAWFQTVAHGIANYSFSDFSYYMGHCNGTELGGHPPDDPYIRAKIDSTTALAQASGNSTKPGQGDWRFRKVALWGCYSDTMANETAEGQYPTWPAAFGIRKGSVQLNGFMFKNAGLFFGGGLPQAGYMSTASGTSVEVAMDFDMLWVCGPNQYPGGCDPTYSFWWAVSTIRGMNPELDQKQAAPTLEGYPYLPYTGVLDWSLVEGDTSGIKNH